MDKTIASRLKTIDPSLETEKQKAISYGLYAIGLIFAMVLFPLVGYAATQTSDHAGDASSELSVTLSKSIEAGKAVAGRALSSKAKAASAAAAPSADITPEIIGSTPEKTAGITGKATATQGAKVLPVASPKKYVFKYPDLPVLSEDMQPVKKTLTGEVGVVIKTGMNVEFDRKASSSTDLWVEFTQGTQVEGVKAFSEFLPGDKVQITYAEAKDQSKRAVRSIKLLKRKTEEEKKREAAAEARAEAAAAQKSTRAEES
ncbi:MAG: hypothetical protein V1882_10725 [Candidatus Omnitrophota bacterium]